MNVCFGLILDHLLFALVKLSDPSDAAGPVPGGGGGGGRVPRPYHTDPYHPLAFTAARQHWSVWIIFTIYTKH